MAVEVAASVPPLPYTPVPAIPGLVTVTGTVAGAAISVASIIAVSWLALTWLVVCAVPFQLMVAVLEKLVPFTVRTNAWPPELVLSGASSLMVGMVPAAAGVVAGEL